MDGIITTLMNDREEIRVAITRPQYDTHLITPPLGIGYLASYL